MANAEAPPKETRDVTPLADRIPPGGTNDADEILGLFLDWVADTGLTLYPAQEEALLEIMAGKHVILGTPTGSGKSLVALGLHFKALCEGRVSFYTSPIKALASEKFFALCNELGPENVGMRTGDASINPEGGVVCCTAEVLSNMALRRRGGARRALRRHGRVPLLRRQGPGRRLAGAAPRPAEHAVSPHVGDARRHVGDRRAAEARHGARGGVRHVGRASRPARLRVRRDAAPPDDREAPRAGEEPDLRRELHAARVRRAGAGADEREDRRAARSARRSARSWRGGGSSPPTARSSAGSSRSASASTTRGSSRATGSSSSSSRRRGSSTSSAAPTRSASA